MKVLVTGATGFIGSHLVKSLHDDNHEVIPVARKLRPWNSDFIRKNLVQINLVNDSLPNLGKIDCVCLLASKQPSIDNKWSEYYDINARQIFHFLNKNIDQLIYVSTTTVELHEGVPNPQNYYGLSKALGERLLKINKNHFNQCSIIRFPSVIGQNHNGGIIHDLKIWIEDGKEIDLFNKGERLRNLIHVSDAVAAIHAIIKSKKTLRNYEEFDVGSEDSLMLHEIVDLLIKMMGKKARVNLLDRVTNALDVLVDNSHAINKLGYIPKPIELSIRQYIKDVE
tara:strand:+ start:187 stop:1032 length:846 start_codon:yes stop_codon:yes gene_type:complete